MADTERLFNKAQGDSLISAINAITARLQEMYTVDDALSSTSENPVQNKVVKVALDGKVDTVSGKGLSTNDYTNDDKESVANSAKQIASTQTISGNPLTLTDCAPINAESLVVELLPKQDLHGQDAPYVGGAGKNKLPMTVAKLKSDNVSGSWSGNAYTYNAVTYTVQTDNDGNVTGIDVHGTATGGNSIISLTGLSVESGQKLNGAPSGGRMFVSNSTGSTDYAADTGSGATVNTTDSNARFYIQVLNGTNINHALYQPMIRLSTEPDPTFAPYSNICPISGYTQTSVEGTGINVFDGVLEDGYINPSTGENASSSSYVRSKNYTPIADMLTYYVKAGTEYDSFTILFYDNEKKYLSYQGKNTVLNKVMIPPANAKYFRLYCDKLSDNTISINYPSTDTQYRTYASTSATIQFGQTVYGGKSDFVEGGTSDEWDIVTFTNEWSDDDITQDGGHRYRYTGTVNDLTPLSDIVCDCFKGVKKNAANIKMGEMSITGSAEYPFIRVVTNMDFNDFKTYIVGKQACFKIPTPSEISTPATPLKLLKGTNNLSTNGTTITLGYQPDNVIGEVKGEIEKCAVDAEFMQFTDGTDTFTDVNLSLDALSHTVSVVGSKIEQKRFICFEVMDKMGGVLQGILASCIAFTDGAKTPSGTAFRAYIDPVSMYVDLRICGSGGSYMLSYQSETSFSASAFYVRVRMMNNL